MTSPSSARTNARVSHVSTAARACIAILAVAVLVGLASDTYAADPSRPNIVLIMADDMGYSDIGCYGGEIDTPHVNQLASQGLRFTQFYNTARCCPTRASLMTGLYPHQAGMGWMTVRDLGHDGYRGDLNKNCLTIAEVLRGAGYGTYMSGKWHVTREEFIKDEKNFSKHNWPLQRGFDSYFGTLIGSGSFYTPGTLTRDNEPITPPADGFYYTDAISDAAAEYISKHADARPDDPFFLYVAYTSPHWPLHAPSETIDKYRGRYDMGWDALRAERHARMIDLGIVKGEWPLTPRDEEATAWEAVETSKKEEMALRMAIYAAQIDVMDQGIGRILDSLRQNDDWDNTLVFFLADNGGCAEGGPWGFEWKPGGELGTDSSFASYGLSWANASNTPFRRYKHWVHEGGISTPLIVHWPAGFEAKGEFRGQPGHLIDIMATCADVAGAEYPTEYEGHQIKPLEGKSLVPAFANKDIDREAIYWEHEGNQAVRIGNWKLVSRSELDQWELYDLEKDRTELNDLSAKYPDRVNEMAAKWQAYAERANVLPLAAKEWLLQQKKK